MIDIIAISLLVVFFILSIYLKNKKNKKYLMIVLVPVFFVFIISAFVTDKLYTNLFFSFLTIVLFIKEFRKMKE